MYHYPVVATLGMAPFVLALAVQGPELTERASGTTAEIVSQPLIVFEGIVFDSDGAPAEGAMVVSNAGGKAVTGRNGNYRLETEVAAGAQSIWITAVGAAGQIASRTVELLAGQQLAWVPPLELATGTSCQPSWLPTFGSVPGTNISVYALAVFDDGNGPALYAGGDFIYANGVPARAIAKWNGSKWAALGSGLYGGVRALCVFDDGSGPALYVGGNFTVAGGVVVNHIAKWDGSSWTRLGSGTTSSIETLAVFDYGSGPSLYAGGDFTTAGGVAASCLAKWNGSAWSALGSGLGGANAIVRSLAVFDDGSGPALHVGGTFDSAGGVAASNIASWNGASWSVTGNGVDGGTVESLAVFDDGSGPALYAGGSFGAAGGVAANGVAKWNGSSWTALDTGVSGSFIPPNSVNALTVFDEGSGPALYAGGSFTIAGSSPANFIAKWNGSSWSALGSGMGFQPFASVYALAAFDDGSGPALFAGGLFYTSGGEATNNIAKWQSSSWTELGSGLGLPVNALTVFDDGRGPALYAGGLFHKAGGAVVNRIARWDGSHWEALSGGLSNEVLSLTVFDDGSGPALYAGGLFANAVGFNVSKWDGSSWFALDNGLTGGPRSVRALIEFDDGSGPAVYAGGEFKVTGGRNVARWNGSIWVAVGGVVLGDVYALEVFDDGHGPALYAGGDIETAGGVTTKGIAKWDGSSWAPLGTGIKDVVRALAVFDDGNGPALYVGGRFPDAGGIPANSLARWDGMSWSTFGGVQSSTPGAPLVSDLHVLDDGCGPALYVAGRFDRAGSLPAKNIARWDGSTWSPLGGGVLGGSFAGIEVRALTTFNDRTGQALHVGGDFHNSGVGDSFLAKWGSPDTTAPVITCPASLVVDDRPEIPGETLTFLVTATDEQDPTPSVECHPPSGSHFPRGTTLVVCTATDASGNSSRCQFTITVGAKVPEILSAGTRLRR